MAANKSTEVPPDQIPEVQRLLQEQQRLDQFRKQNAKFFEYLRQIASDYNEALSAARAACKQRGVSCGPIQIMNVKTTYDADALYDLYGREAFLELGGTLETIQQRGLDKKRVDFNIESGRIDKDRAALIRKRSLSFKKNEEIIVPGES
jgi:hypothetical protein